MTSTTTDLSYDAWQAAHHDAAARVLADLDRLHDDTLDHARRMSALHHKRPTPTSRKRADDAWALARLRDGGVDPIGDPIDPTYAGRAKWERAWLLATGVPWMHPDDDHTPPEHTAGEHEGTTLRRSYDGDLPPCPACMEDEVWTEVRTYAANNRKATR